MESKQILSQIEFKFTRPSYPVSEKVISYFGTTTPQTGDWVGLFRVGWKSVKEHHSKKPVSLETIELSKKVNIDYSFVVFEKSELPKDKDSYYQFVYVSKDDVVRGASRPFQFEWESVELKDELKQLRQQMWSTMEQQQEQPRELWSKIVEEKEREIREREREQREKERELREFERVERERERERELREKELREVRELREIRERKQSEKERELREREREEREWSKERRRHHEKESRRQEKERDSSLQRKTRRSDLNNNTSKLVELLVESEKDMSSRSTWEKLEEEQILAKLMQAKHMPYSTSSIKPSKKEEEVIKKVEELFLENSKLSSTLRSKHSELVDLKKECEELKQFNTELVSKLSHEGRKLETVERELESEREVLRKLEEQKEREQYERPESRKHYLEKEEEKKYLLKEENERLRDAIRRLTHSYETESNKYWSLKSKLLKIDESLVKKITKRLSEKRSISEIEESTWDEIKTLKKLIDELRGESEVVKRQIKFVESEYPRPEVTSKTTIIKEKSTTTSSSSSLPRISSQPEYLSLIETRPTIQLVQETYPSISISTSIPEIKSSKSSSPKQLPTSIKTELVRSKLAEIKEILEQSLKKKTIEDELKSKWEKLVEKTVVVPEKATVEIIYEKEKPSSPSSYWEKREEQIKKLKAFQQKYFLKQLEEQARHHIRETPSTPSQYTTICPVCGIVVSKELNQVEFELHVNSHFTD